MAKSLVSCFLTHGVFNLGLPSFDTMMKNASVLFTSTELLQQPLSCAYVLAICVLTVITVVQLIPLNFLSVFFYFYTFLTFFLSLFCLFVCLSCFLGLAA